MPWPWEYKKIKRPFPPPTCAAVSARSARVCPTVAASPGARLTRRRGLPPPRPSAPAAPACGGRRRGVGATHSSPLNDRSEPHGARWSLDGAEAVLCLRALWTNGDFELCWTFHLYCEYERNDASRGIVL